MANVSIRELRHHGGEVVERGEQVTITRAGKPVTRLVALARSPAPLDELRRRRARLPHVDPAALRRGLDHLIEPGL